MGSFLSWGPFEGPFYKGAVLFWGAILEGTLFWENYSHRGLINESEKGFGLYIQALIQNAHFGALLGACQKETPVAPEFRNRP